MNQIRFNRPTFTGREHASVVEALRAPVLSGDGPWTHLCMELLERATDIPRVLLTASCTHALEMAAMLLELNSGDEVIMPSFTFVSTANAFVLQGAVPVFADVDPSTMNVAVQAVEAAITARTRAIVVVHYAGVACDMAGIHAVANRHQLIVIEDAAQGLGASHDRGHLGTLGAMGTYSFHDTKNVNSGGEGGALLVNDERYWARAKVIRDKGTNRSQFLEGLVDKYSWVDVGSSYLMAELNAAFLAPQLESLQEITAGRVTAWNRYRELLRPLVEAGRIEVSQIPEYASHNGHLHYVKVRNQEERSGLIAWLRQRGITAPFHYVPLHSAPAGRRFGRFHGEDVWTTRESSRLLRLPLYHGISAEDQDRVIDAVNAFFSVH